MTLADSSIDVRDPARDVRLDDVLRFFWRWGFVILGCAAIFGIITFLIVVFVVPPTYSASAMLVVVPPTFSSGLKPQTLTLKAYQEILESDAVIAGTQSLLADEGLQSPPRQLRIGEDLESRIFVSRRSEETELAPVIQATAFSRAPEDASTIANAWATVFQKQARTLMEGATSNAVNLVSQQYETARERLMALEDGLLRLESDFEDRLSAAEKKWEARIGEHQDATRELVAEYRAESQTLIEAFNADRNLAVRRQELKILSDAVGEARRELTSIGGSISRLGTELRAIDSQLEHVSPVITLRKAISDETLWNTEASAQVTDSKQVSELQEKGLITQEVNPVFAELSSRKAIVEVDLASKQALEEQLETRLVALTDRTRSVERELGSDEAALETLKIRRDSGLEKLTEGRRLVLEDLRRQERVNLDAIARERTTRTAQLGRDIAQQADLLEQLLGDYNEAVLAREQPEDAVTDVRLASPAVAPSTPSRKKVALQVLIAALAGAAAGTLIGLFRDVDSLTA